MVAGKRRRMEKGEGAQPDRLVSGGGSMNLCIAGLSSDVGPPGFFLARFPRRGSFFLWDHVG
jgi:hypothetical protein